ncbi:hypothetical protein IE53DRAFT_408757 [Violaceomyces palustris]|uniref:Uncharacterized protein n=1 Tax=Violaceomyces palustris TaxID=1673888 RepID=A0ACD0P5L7_9BASI|nr:hypothetical protein IE53DRAFT_408757 [Violaceomyces palustris]
MSQSDAQTGASSAGSLLDSLVTDLGTNPPALNSSGTVRLHALFSIPRLAKSLYPLAHIDPEDLQTSRSSQPVQAWVEQIILTASWSPETDLDPNSESVNGGGAEPVTNHPGRDRPESDQGSPVMAYALEAFLYTLPEEDSALLYISKLDSTGFGPRAIPRHLRPLVREQLVKAREEEGGKRLGGDGRIGYSEDSLTSALTGSFISHFASLRHWSGSDLKIGHLSLHILARSQSAYLFPSSPENPDKKILSDGGLIKWWREVVSKVVVRVRSESFGAAVQGEEKDIERDQPGPIQARPFYLIPGYNKLESHVLLPLPRPTPPRNQPSSSLQDASPPSSNGQKTTTDTTSTSDPDPTSSAGWTYGHPYSLQGSGCSSEEELPPLPLHWRRLHTGGQPDSSKGDSIEVDSRRKRTINTLMPHFSDDPKSRFLDELMIDSHEHGGGGGFTTRSAGRGGGRPDSDRKEGKEGKEEEEEGIERDVHQPSTVGGVSDEEGELKRRKKIKLDHDPTSAVTLDDGPAKTEPLDGRTKEGKEGKGEQEESVEGKASSSSLFSSPSPTTTKIVPPPPPTSERLNLVPIQTIRDQMRERSRLDRISPDEFWERMGFRQECCSGNAVGVLFVSFTQLTTTTPSIPIQTNAKPKPSRLSIPHPTLQELVFKNLMRDSCVWSSEVEASRLTSSWFENVDKAIRRKGGWIGHPQEDRTTESSRFVGRDILWSDIRITAPLQQIRDANEIFNTNHATSSHHPGSAAAASSPSVKPNVLSVKRKKKQV